MGAAVASTSDSRAIAPYVDTVEDDVELILDLAGVVETDYLIDLGSGDGRFVIAAARRGAAGYGIDIDAALVAGARARAAAAGLGHRAVFLEGDLFGADISRATVVTIYLFPDANLKLRPKLLRELRPGTRLVSNSFTMGAWAPDDRAQGRTSGGALLWHIPAHVAGTWHVNVGEAPVEVVFTQCFQELTAAAAGFTVDNLRLDGRRLSMELRSDNGTNWALRVDIDGERLAGAANASGNGREAVVPVTGRRLHHPALAGAEAPVTTGCPQWSQ